jgi:hypothetical protein
MNQLVAPFHEIKDPRHQNLMQVIIKDHVNRYSQLPNEAARASMREFISFFIDEKRHRGSWNSSADVHFLNEVEKYAKLYFALHDFNRHMISQPEISADWQRRLGPLCKTFIEALEHGDASFNSAFFVMQTVLDDIEQHPHLTKFKHELESWFKNVLYIFAPHQDAVALINAYRQKIHRSRGLKFFESGHTPPAIKVTTAPHPDENVEAPYNVFFVLIRPNPHQANEYDILLKEVQSASDEKGFRTFPNQIITNTPRDQQVFEWIVLAPASRNFNYVSYAALKVFKTTAEAEAMHQQVCARAKWEKLQPFIEAARTDNPLYGLRIKSYMTQHIVPHLFRAHPETMGSPRAVSPRRAHAHSGGLGTEWPSPDRRRADAWQQAHHVSHGARGASPARSFVDDEFHALLVLIRHNLNRTDAYEILMQEVQGPVMNYWTLPVGKMNMRSNDGFEWIGPLGDAGTPYAALQVFKTWDREADDTWGSQRYGQSNGFEWRNIQHFITAATQGDILYGKRISQHMTNAIVPYLKTHGHGDLLYAPIAVSPRRDASPIAHRRAYPRGSPDPESHRHAELTSGLMGRMAMNLR